MGESRMQQLLGLGGTSATADDAAQILEAALPVLVELAEATAAVVVRQDATGPAVAHSAGAGLGTADLDDVTQGPEPRLGPIQVPETWAGEGIGAVAALRLPGHEGVLALAWPADVGASAELDLAVSTVVAGVARTVAAADLRDLTARVDNAQHLAHMGDYDWHIPSDTNRWSDELFRIYGHEPQSFNPDYERFLSLIHPDDRDRISGLHQRAYATGDPYEMIERIVRPDGEVRYLSSNGEVVMDEQGAPVRMRGTCIDITERVLAERAREHLDARYRSLVEAAPDAILVLDATGHVLDANPQARDMLKGDPARRWVGDIGPLDSDGLGVELSRLDGTTLLVDVTRAVMSPAEGAPGGELVAVFLRDSSARLAGEELAALQSQAQLRRRQALEINDNVVQGLVAAAYALDSEQHPVASAYLDRTLTAARSMMDDLLEPLDGQDLAPGDLVRASAATVGEPAAPTILRPRTSSYPVEHGHRVLVVDDAEDLRAVLRARLERTDGFTVVGEAADGVEAVELARELQPDLVLLDLAMPRMDGLEALPLIRAAASGARVIVFSGFNQNTLAHKALAAGADRYVVKGGSMRELMSLLQSVVQPG